MPGGAWGLTTGRRWPGNTGGFKTRSEVISKLFFSAIFMETSSKEGHNILDSLVLLAREMCSSEDVEVQSSTLLIRWGYLVYSPSPKHPISPYMLYPVMTSTSNTIAETTNQRETVVVPPDAEACDEEKPSNQQQELILYFSSLLSLLLYKVYREFIYRVCKISDIEPEGKSTRETKTLWESSKQKYNILWCYECP